MRLANFPFDINTGPPTVPPGLSKPSGKAGGPRFAIIKFGSVYNVGDRRRLAARGVKFYGYVPEDAFLAKVPPGLWKQVESDPSVVFIGEYLPAYRLDGVTLGFVERGEKGQKKLVVQVFDDEALGPVMDEVETLGGSSEVFSDRPGLNGKFLKVGIGAGDIAALASLDGVQWVEEELVPEYYNEAAAPVMNADYAWAQAVPLTGTGQVVAVCDSGLDTGDTSTMHLDFYGTTSGGLPKIKQTFAYARTDDWSDIEGHGTHVAGSVTGFGAKSNELVPGTYLRGTAYDAQLVFQSVGIDAGGGMYIPDLHTRVFPDAYAAGARVHSNSWGYGGSSGVYGYPSVMADTYLWDHKDFTALFSAGNDGTDKSPADGVVDLNSMGSPATAKNVITVGASENDRPSITMLYNVAIPGRYSPPISNDRMADAAGGMAAFSSRGPCVDGRIKPDVVAPGTYLLSSKSSLTGTAFTKASKYGYDSSLDPYYEFKSGTSMACPLASGAAVLVREFLTDAGLSAPSSALIKGMLITGAADMTPGQYAAPENDVTARPDNNQGWGRVDMRAALYPDAPRRVLYDDFQTGLATDGSRGYELTVDDASVEVRVNLVWTDYPATAGASPCLVNNLDLTVIAPDGTEYHGNIYTGSESTPDPTGYDTVNNVEGVTIPASALTTGTLSVEVYGSGVSEPLGAALQPFAIVFSGGFSGPPSVSGILPSGGVNNVSTPVTVSGAGFMSGASLYVGGVQCSVGSVAADSIDAVVPPGLPAGELDVMVVNPDTQSATLAGGFTAAQDPDPPSAPQGLSASPGDGFADLSWDANTEPDISGYRVFFNAYSTTVGPVESHRLDGLTNGVTYDIYLKALDAGGNLSQSSATVHAIPFAPAAELPHYDWDPSPAWQCRACHVEPSGGLLPPGFDFRETQGLCLSCHNTASVGHRSPVREGGPHTSMSNVTSGGAVVPTFGGVTSGEYSDTMYTHLKDGDKMVCVTCHNAMQKPHDTGRYWEILYPQGGGSFVSTRGGWAGQGQAVVRAYSDSSLYIPQESRTRDALRVPDGEFTYDEYAGTVLFQGVTSGYAYLSLAEPYLRVTGSDNAFCTDCHTAKATHRTYNCLKCHFVHGEERFRSVRGGIRIPDGTTAQVVFARYTGMNSFADGDSNYDGVCEVCHTATAYYRSDGSAFDTHTSTGLDYSRADCTVCHGHAAGFSVP